MSDHTDTTPEPADGGLDDVFGVTPAEQADAEHGWMPGADAAEAAAAAAKDAERQQLSQEWENVASQIEQTIADEAAHRASTSHAAAEMTALQAAIDLYEEGEVDPAAIADKLWAASPDIAAAFVERWHADDEGLDINELGQVEQPPPANAAEWVERMGQRQATEAQLRAIEEDAAARRDAEQRQAELASAAEAELARARRQLRGFDALVPLMTAISQNAGLPPVESPKDIRERIALSYNTALEAKRAQRAAEMKADFDADQHYHDAGWLSGAAPDFDREAAVGRHLQRHEVDPRRVQLQPTAEARAAEVRASLEMDDRERAINDGWQAIDGLDVTARQAAEEARRKGLR